MAGTKNMKLSHLRCMAATKNLRHSKRMGATKNLDIATP